MKCYWQDKEIELFANSWPWETFCKGCAFVKRNKDCSHVWWIKPVIGSAFCIKKGHEDDPECVFVDGVCTEERAPKSKLMFIIIYFFPSLRKLYIVVTFSS